MVSCECDRALYDSDSSRVKFAVIAECAEIYGESGVLKEIGEFACTVNLLCKIKSKFALLVKKPE